MSTRRATQVAASVAAAAVAGGVVLLAPAPAYAADLRITQVSSEAGSVNAVVTSSGGSIDPASVELRLDGGLVASSATVASETGVDRTTILAIDTSGSMRGSGLNGAKSAASDYLTAVPDDVEVGLVAFADTSTVVSQPTTDRAQVRQALTGLTATGETALYDGVLTAVEASGSTGIRSVLLLSDGGDTASAATLNEASRAAAASGATVDAIAFQTQESVDRTLAQITESTNGQVVTASGGSDVAQAFAASAQESSNQVLVTAQIPAELAGASTSIAVTASVGGDSMQDSAVVTLGETTASGAEATTTADPGLFGAGWVLPVALGLAFAGLVTVIVLVWRAIANRPKNARVLERELRSYTVQAGRAEPVEAESSADKATESGATKIAQNASELAGRIVKKRNLDEELQRRLHAAALNLRPGEWFLIHTLATVGGGLLFLLLTGRILPTLAGLAIGFFIPMAILSRKEKKRREAFVEQLPDTLTLLASSLNAGHSFSQAVDAVVQDGQEPIAEEFARALNQSRVGVPIEDTLEEVAERMKCEDLSWVVMAVRINREVGGNLSEVLTNVANTLRERMYLKRQVKALSADGRLSTYVLTALPIVLALFLLVQNPTYIEPLFTTVIGLIMLVAGGVMLVAGWFWMKKLTNVEV